jgi:hypothetical protein
MERTVFVSALLALVSALCTADGIGETAMMSPVNVACA